MVPLRKNQMYIKVADIMAHWEANKNRKLNFSGNDEAEMDAALKASMETWNKEEDDRDGGSNVGTVFNAK